jgi:hypothetical protein
MSFLNETAKSLLRTWAPALADRLHSRRADALIRRKREESGLTRLEARFLAVNEAKVQAGPFAGMSYLPQAKGSVLLPKLLGTYEMEIASWIELVVALAPRRIIDIGCAEGYYAVGLARRLPECGVFAFDINQSAQHLCRQLAALNGVEERVHVSGRCSAADLERFAGPGTVVICDIEGAEGLLLDPATAPALRRTTLIVELHDCLAPGASGLVRSRFAATHALDEEKAEERSSLRLPALADFISTEQALMLSEHRVPGQSWFLLRPLITDH